MRGRCGSECMTGVRSLGVGECGEGDGSAFDKLAVFGWGTEEDVCGRGAYFSLRMRLIS